MDEKEVKAITERRNILLATMDACELAEAFRDDGGEAVAVSDPKMTRVGIGDGFVCTYY